MRPTKNCLFAGILFSDTVKGCKRLHPRAVEFAIAVAAGVAAGSIALTSACELGYAEPIDEAS
jgi:hypothetical protein